MEKEKMSYDEAIALVLKPGVTVEVKPIIRERAFFPKGHDGEFMYTGVIKSYQLPYSNNTRSYVKVFDTQEEQEAFEVLMNKDRGSLNVYNRESPFWLKYTVDVTKEGKTLDLSLVAHCLEHKVLQACTHRIASDWASRFKPGMDFALVNDVQLREADNHRADITEKAMDFFIKVRKSNSKMFNVLRLLEKMPPKESIDKTDFLKTELLKVIDQKDGGKGNKIKCVTDFIKIMEDARFENKVLIYDAMDINEIKLLNGMFKITATDTIMGKSIEQAAEWLDLLQNQEEKILLQQRVKKG
jgi:hypothetical protein